jgi:2-C-methyl-D-erythritol 4-phosphate cytidylyltransferase/2-C-methyl-D-erythritol 2,4-cyclodiphosphate synthase
MTAAAIIVAAGRGSRAGGEIPKQYRPLAGKPVLARTLETFLAHPRIEIVQPVVHREDEALFAAIAKGLSEAFKKKLKPAVPGGDTRQRSVRQGLEAVARSRSQRASGVLIHDAARPFASPALIDTALKALSVHRASVPGVAPVDTIKVVDSDALVIGTPERDALRAVQTPQAFDLAAILDAHRRAARAGVDGFRDDGALAEWAGIPVHVFEGEASNVKLTHDADFADAERRLAGERPSLIVRVGTGFDVHALSDGDHVWLGGVRIASERGVVAHSDGDVVLHALTDALLGALAEGDIGVHFPPSDPQWRGASSDRFLAFAAERVRLRGGRIDNLDVTVLCESPRVGPHREAIRARIGEIAGLPVETVSIKATTTERLGFIGRGEGIAAQAIAAVRLPAGAP